MARGIKNKYVCGLFQFVWQHWYAYDEDKVTAVLGWRTCRVVSKAGQPRCSSPCFWWFQ